jgi:phosphatidylserine synthase
MVENIKLKKAKKRIIRKKVGLIILILLSVLCVLSSDISKLDIIVFFVVYLITDFWSDPLDDLVDVIEKNIEKINF